MTQEKFVVDLYIRVSTDRQVREGDSLEEQESELKKFCEFRNLQTFGNLNKIWEHLGASKFPK